MSRRDDLETYLLALAAYLAFRFAYLSIAVLYLDGSITYDRFSVPGTFFYLWGVPMGYAVLIATEIVTLSIAAWLWWFIGADLADEQHRWLPITAPFAIGCLNWTWYGIATVLAVWNGNTEVWFF